LIKKPKLHNIPENLKIMKKTGILFLFSLITLFLMFSNSGFAQNRFAYKVLHKELDFTDKIGLGIGNTRIPKGFNNAFNPNLNLNYSKKITQRLDIRADVSYGIISSPSTIDSLALVIIDLKNLVKEYKGNIFSMQIMPQFNLFPSFHFTDRSTVNLYGGVGAGYLFATRNEILGGQKLGKNSNGNISTSKNSSIYVPAMIGLSYKLGEYFDIAIENQFNFTFSNNLDGIFVPEIRDKRDNIRNLNFVLRTYFSIKRKLPYIG
jgi:hypothetical protein